MIKEKKLKIKIIRNELEISTIKMINLYFFWVGEKKN